MRAEHRQRLGIALFPLAALAMHQLRYELAYGSDASRELAAHGHGYLHALTPLVVLAAALGAGGWLARLARAWHRGESDGERGRGLAVLWALAAAALLCIYAGQESLEALFATGHPHGLAGILGHGGLWALPAAIVLGGALALVVRGGEALVAHVVRMHRPRPLRAAVRAPRRAARPASVALPRLEPLAGGRAGRAPPATAVRCAGRRLAHA
jgi:hypothetical protein